MPTEKVIQGAVDPYKVNIKVYKTDGNGGK